MIVSIDDFYFKLGRPLLDILYVSSHTTLELNRRFTLSNPEGKTKFENVLAWLESHGHVRYAGKEWHLNSRLNLFVLAEGICYEYGVTLEELRSKKPVGRHVSARAHLCWYAKSHGWTYQEIGRFLGRDADFSRNAAERHLSFREAA